MKRVRHLTLVIASGGLLASAAILEAVIADVHFVSVFALHEHTPVPIVVHLIAYASALLSLSPALTDVVGALGRGALNWRISVLLATALLIIAGRVIVGSGLAFLFLVGSVLWDARRAKS